MSAESIAAALVGHRGSGSWWIADCPVCQGADKLGVKDDNRGRLVARCFSPSGDKSCSPADIIAELRRRGIYDPTTTTPASLTPEELEWRRQSEAAERARRIANARSIWEETVDATGTPAQTYLYSRLLQISPMPEPMRFLYGSVRFKRAPSMCCRINHVEQGAIGVHCTYLTHDGNKVSIGAARKTFGVTSGGAVQLGWPNPDQWLCVGEGIESTLSVALALGVPAWAALSAWGIRSLVLPPEARMVLIACDHDESGNGQAAALAASWRWSNEGRTVKIAKPPVAGSDWNDVRMGRAPARLGKPEGASYAA